MGQKSNPIILRLNKTNQHWNSCWYSDDNYATPFLQDCKINAYINNSQRQLKRFPPLSFIKRQRGDLQVALFSAKAAKQFSAKESPYLKALLKKRKKKHKKYKRGKSPLITHNIFKGSSAYYTKEQGAPLKRMPATWAPPYKGVAPHALELSVKKNSPQGAPLLEPLGLLSSTKKKLYFRNSILLAMGNNCEECPPLHYVHQSAGHPENQVKNTLNEEMPLGRANNSFHAPTPVKGVLKKPPLIIYKKSAVKERTAQHFVKEKTAVKRGSAVKSLPNITTHLEYSIYKHYNGWRECFPSVRSKLYLIKGESIYINAFFLVGQVVSLLEDRKERRTFRQIKHRIVREMRKNPIIKGVRILCSGRVASRSKKAQKARRESIQWGATSLNIFSEHVSFANSFALTTFGKIGVKAWISYNFTANLPV